MTSSTAAPEPRFVSQGSSYHRFVLSGALPAGQTVRNSLISSPLLVGAHEAGGLDVVTGTHTGAISVAVVQLDDGPPAIPAGYAAVAEISIVAAPGTDAAVVGDPELGPNPELDVIRFAPGQSLRLRVCAVNRGGNYDGGGTHLAERYLLVAWPAPVSASTVLATDEVDHRLIGRWRAPEATLRGPSFPPIVPPSRAGGSAT